MAIKTIPARTIKTCDCCGVEIKATNGCKEAKLTLKQHALDMQGSACADATCILDLCDGCAWTVSEAINKAVAAQPKGGTPQ